MGDVTLDADNFTRRLVKLYQNWEANRSTVWANTTALAIPVGAASDDLRYLKSISLHLWLFGYELPATLLEAVAETAQREAGIKLVIVVRPKTDCTAEVKQLLDAIKEADPDPLVGHLPKDKHEGKVAETFSQLFAESGLPAADVSAGFADLLACKDANEVLNVKKAALLAARVAKDFVVAKVESIIDEGKSVKHSKLSELTEEVITNPRQANINLKAENVDIAYPPIFQSGGKFDLKVSAPSDDNPLHDSVIVVGIGTRYSSYCANVGRTYIINPTKKQEVEYEALLAAQEAAIAALMDGATVSSVVDAAIKVLKDKGQHHLIGNLTKNLGFGMGLEFRESAYVLSAKNENVVRPGMVFNVSIGVQGLENPAAKDEKGKVYAIQIADTVVINEGGKGPDVATAIAPKSWDKISYSLKDDEEEEGEEDKVDVKLEDMTNGPPNRKSLRSDDPTYKSAEQLRKEKQDALLKQKNQETLARLTARQVDGPGEPSTSGRKISEVVAYRSVGDMPATKDLILQVDSKNECVLAPIYGIMVPFHITTIKNVTSNQDHDHATIRVTFNFGPSYEPFTKFPSCIFLKELSFRSVDMRHAAKTVQEIKMLRSSVQQRDKERVERAGLVEQEKLQIGKRVFKLSDLWVRPNFGGKGRKVPGTLEAHLNGFKYWNPKNETINVMYNNIKHAFFQPAENEMITILHFHLKNPIMLGQKKTKDVQFYAEVMEVVQTLDGGRRNMYDPDELEEEQRERDRRNKVNSDFQQFVKRVQELWEKEDYGLEWDIPYRALGFSGVPHRTTAFIMPTVSCLVELTEMPFTIISLEDIEIVNLERVGFNLKNFDMAIVFKDFSRDVLRIDAIPSKSLETIKDFLTSQKIKYYESKLNLAWKPILKNIQEDPEGFIAEGGWEFLNLERSDDEGGEAGEEEQSEDYAPEESADESSEEDDSSDEESVVDSEDASDEDESDEEGEDEEEGKTWEELEDEAARQDKERFSSDSEDERKAGRKRGGGGGGGGPAKRRK